jgi:hypothetical protein
VRAIAAGDDFSMALKSDGTVWTWGHNDYGTLGNGGKEDTTQPALVRGLPEITVIAAAGRHALALDSTGHVWTWGDVPNRSPELKPRQQDDLADIIAIAAGDNHGIALDKSGAVWLWGDYGFLELNGPLRHPLITDTVTIAGAYQLTVGLKKDGTVWTIGYGAAGQLGHGTVENFSSKPVIVPGLAGVKQISARYMNVMALKGDDTVWGWGSNHFRQLGNPAFSDDPGKKPVRAAGLKNAVAVASGKSHSVAVAADGQVWNWGENDNGSLGADADLLSRSDVPMRPGDPIPPECQILFACETAGGKVIRLCGNQNPSDVDKWTGIHYRFGPGYGPPELMFPTNPDSTPPSLYYSPPGIVRFQSGNYTYRVNVSGAVTVSDARGKTVTSMACTERPQVYQEYLEENLPCDPKSARPCKTRAAR